MRYLLIFIFLFAVRFGQAQDAPLFRIVSHQGSVMLDGDSVKSGQLVFTGSKRLKVTKNSYAYILTVSGYTIKLGSGNYDVLNVKKYVMSQNKANSNSMIGVVCRPEPDLLKFIGINELGANQILGDSVYLRWKKRKTSESKRIEPPYIFQVHSIFEDLMYEEEVSDNFIRINLKRIAGEDINTLIRLKGSTQHFRIYFLYPAMSASILNDLSGISASQLQKDVLDLVIYDTNQLNLDLMFHLDKIANVDLSSLPQDLQNYVTLLKAKYEFE